MDITWIIQYLLPEPQYGGAFNLHNQAEYDALRWLDERPKPTWGAIVAAWPNAQLTRNLSDLNSVLEEAYLQFLPNHIGQEYLTDELITGISTLKLVITDNNKNGLYALSKRLITNVTLPPQMEADRTALLALYP